MLHTYSYYCAVFGCVLARAWLVGVLEQLDCLEWDPGIVYIYIIDRLLLCLQFASERCTYEVDPFDTEDLELYTSSYVLDLIGWSI